ncbi:uncharacterized protein MONBRDRAFT_28677 [Monosiga brevicollis MX1]|uniref:NAD-dependent epimerase/dehydratase domain-containing protein n=1 Tax=Monosiga brevicollis TaxID=81824 RepID=A9V8V3_MONBE|nr:uncharacterized protein MONBRDRAFT_28677 [Monosiga brevicollis MX1]EDQ85938.1 predicted protein [Monosiga brevicollis MX1]|eukprot:XP_001749132.1 hypothetical protein [Monosiga brevicollis MX1]
MAPSFRAAAVLAGLGVLFTWSAPPFAVWGADAQAPACHECYEAADDAELQLRQAIDSVEARLHFDRQAWAMTGQEHPFPARAHSLATDLGQVVDTVAQHRAALDQLLKRLDALDVQHHAARVAADALQPRVAQAEALIDTGFRAYAPALDQSATHSAELTRAQAQVSAVESQADWIGDILLTKAGEASQLVSIEAELSTKARDLEPAHIEALVDLLDVPGDINRERSHLDAQVQATEASHTEQHVQFLGAADTSRAADTLAMTLLLDTARAETAQAGVTKLSNQIEAFDPAAQRAGLDDAAEKLAATRADLPELPIAAIEAQEAKLSTQLHGYAQTSSVATQHEARLLAEVDAFANLRERTSTAVAEVHGYVHELTALEALAATLSQYDQLSPETVHAEATLTASVNNSLAEINAALNMAVSTHATIAQQLLSAEAHVQVLANQTRIAATLSVLQDTTIQVSATLAKRQMALSSETSLLARLNDAAVSLSAAQPVAQHELELQVAVGSACAVERCQHAQELEVLWTRVEAALNSTRQRSAELNTLEFDLGALSTSVAWLQQHETKLDTNLALLETEQRNVTRELMAALSLRKKLALTPVRSVGRALDPAIPPIGKEERGKEDEKEDEKREEKEEKEEKEDEKREEKEEKEEKEGEGGRRRARRGRARRRRRRRGRRREGGGVGPNVTGGRGDTFWLTFIQNANTVMIVIILSRFFSSLSLFRVQVKIATMKVLVTGASGYIAGHLVQQLLAKGHTVRGTVRSLAKTDAVGYLQQLPGATERLELIEADLLQPGSFDAAAQDCEIVYHTASPFFRQVDKPDDLIVPAVQGTRNVLSACAKAPSVKRVVVTSSFAAVLFGHDMEKDPSPFTEADWNQVSTAEHPEPMHWYRASKIQAERAAWAFVENPDVQFDVVTLNPPMVIGPWLPGYTRPNESSMIIKEKLTGEIKAVPAGGIGYIDVRDLARAHILAGETPEANGRYLVTSGVPTHLEVAQLLKTLEPNSAIVTEPPTEKRQAFLIDAGKAARDLKLTDYIPLEQTLRDQITSLRQAGLLDYPN